MEGFPHLRPEGLPWAVSQGDLATLGIVSLQGLPPTDRSYTRKAVGPPRMMRLRSHSQPVLPQVSK